jgi:threonine/homoserine/homoserine lactone efflux protein
MLALGLLFVLVALATDLVYVGLATTLRRRWAGRPGLARAGHLGSALVLMGLGAWALMAERPRG